MQFLDIEHQWIHVDILVGATHSETFRRMNPNARVPVVELPDGSFLWESNAILNYLAEGTAFLPREKLERARVLQWQFFEQYSHEPYMPPQGASTSTSAYPNIRNWFARIEQIPGYVAMALENA
jgi:glutathione S-transferase